MSDQVYTFNCPFCDQEQEAEDAWQGLEAECSECSQVFTIPSRTELQNSNKEPHSTSPRSAIDSSSFIFSCPFCGKDHKGDVSWGGLVGECSSCQSEFTIPEPDLNNDTEIINRIPDDEQTNSIIPPQYKQSLFDKCINWATFGKYIEARETEEDRAGSHVQQMLQSGKKKLQKLEAQRERAQNEQSRIWDELRESKANEALESMGVESLTSIKGVGKVTINNLKNAGFHTASDILNYSDKLNNIPRISDDIADSLVSACSDYYEQEKNTFYPVFTDKTALSPEIKFLHLTLNINGLSETISALHKPLAELTSARSVFPSLNILTRILNKPQNDLSDEEQYAYKIALSAHKAITQTEVPSSISGELTQDEYIRALGILEATRPRPIDESISRGRGTHAGDPSLSHLKGFTSEEAESHKSFGKERDKELSDKYREASSLFAAGGIKALKINGFPQDKQLVKEIENFPLDESLLKDITLRNYQRFAPKFILSQKQVVIGDEMGLGKTIQAICVIAHLEATRSDSSPSLYVVVCPASIRLNWEREVKRFTDIPIYKVKGCTSFKDHPWVKNGGIIVTSYESVKWIPILPDRVSVCIVDEAQYIKNPQAKRTQYCKKILRNSEHAICMTGTPIENNIEEFLEIFDAVKSGISTELRALLLKSDDPRFFMNKIQSIYLRRNKQDVLSELPPLNITLEEVELTQHELQNHRLNIEDDECHYMNVRGNLNEPHECGASKLKRVMSLIAEYRLNRRNVIVFSYFVKPIEWFQQQDESVFAIHGRINPSVRQDIIDIFNEPLHDDEIGKLMVAQIKSGGVGLNIQSASAVILLEPQFNPALEEQAISRVHRMGQRNSVDVHRIICKNTIEEVLLQRLYQKQEVMDLYAKDSYLKNLTNASIDKSSRPSASVEKELRRATSMLIAQGLYSVATLKRASVAD